LSGTLRRRARQTGISPALGNHSFRAIGLTAYMANGGTLEEAQELANHADARTTRLYIGSFCIKVRNATQAVSGRGAFARVP